METSVFSLVVGDLLEVETGDILPCDGIMISGHSILLNGAAFFLAVLISCLLTTTPFLLLLISNFALTPNRH